MPNILENEQYGRGRRAISILPYCIYMPGIVIRNRRRYDKYLYIAPHTASTESWPSLRSRRSVQPCRPAGSPLPQRRAAPPLHHSRTYNYTAPTGSLSIADTGRAVPVSRSPESPLNAPPPAGAGSVARGSQTYWCRPTGICDSFKRLHACTHIFLQLTVSNIPCIAESRLNIKRSPDRSHIL